MEYTLQNIKKVFLIGIGGVGISALAQLFISRGIEVSGLNDEDSPKTLAPLRALGATILYEKDFTELPEADLYVYSDAWLFRGPRILEAARNTGKPVVSYFEALGQVARQYKVIAIAGTHGKTTTTAMIAEVFEEAGLDPTVVVGSIVKKFGSNFRKGSGEYLVVEADEFNKHFLHFHPYMSVVTNIEADHLDVYKDLADIQNTFGLFLNQTQHAVICNPSDSTVAPVVVGTHLSVIDYGQYLSRVPKLTVPGEHNRKNAAAAMALCEAVGIDTETIESALASFAGTWRRLERKGETKTGTIAYDDYAHHPTEVKASLEALRELYPKGQKKITVVFQPHLYSRTKALFEEFVTAFTEADAVYFLPIYFAREEPDPSISSELLAARIPGAKAFASFKEAEEYFKTADIGDVFVTMGAGEAYKIGDTLLK